jgi:hypothetical protein
MKAALSDVIQTHFKDGTCASNVTPTASPAIVPKGSSTVNVPTLTPSIPSNTVENSEGSLPKRVCHGFST